MPSSAIERLYATVGCHGNAGTHPTAPATLKPATEWNDYHITAKGQNIILSINGVKCSELLDQEEGHFDLKGILGLQLRAGEPMTVQFKDILLKQR